MVYNIREHRVYATWFESLRDRRAQSRISARIDRLAHGLIGDAKPVGKGVSELRIDYGPGYRVYFKRVETTVYLLLCGGDKGTQDRDIKTALRLSDDFKG
jgi:putative addiction module killer protein